MLGRAVENRGRLAGRCPTELDHERVFPLVVTLCALAFSVSACDCGGYPGAQASPEGDGGAAGSEGGPPPTVAQFVAALAEKECVLAARCEAVRPDLVGSWLCRSTADELTRWTQEEVDSGRQLYLPEDAKACLASLPSLGCEGLGLSWVHLWDRAPCDALRMGGQLGDACGDYSNFCATRLLCSEELPPAPQFCVTTEPGGPCDGRRCVPGQYCAEDGLCVLNSAEGEPCGGQCASGLLCTGQPDPQEVFLCLPPPVAGASCFDPTVGCVGEHQSATCAGLPTRCAGESLCLPAPGGASLCQTGRAEGEGCLDEAAQRCGAGLRCLDGSCTTIVGRGDPCQVAASPRPGRLDSCVVGQACVAGRCVQR